MDVLVHIYLGGEEDRPCVGHGEVPALHRERQQVLWNLGNLETAKRREGRAWLTARNRLTQQRPRVPNKVALAWMPEHSREFIL